MVVFVIGGRRVLFSVFRRAHPGDTHGNGGNLHANRGNDHQLLPGMRPLLQGLPG